ncbi:MAG TPA: YcaO-like family protein [Kofleriaceae bacterium]|nr:YcaO-like family protein [Kofleriaceae bacterium]
MGQPAAIGPDAVPALDPAAELVASGDIIVGFLGAADAAVIEDLAPEDLSAILARVDGRATAGEIAAALAADYDPDSVLAVLGALVGRGLRIDAPHDPRQLPPDATLVVLGDGLLAGAVAAALPGAAREPLSATAALRGRDVAIAAVEEVPFAVALEITRAALAAEVPVLFALAQRDGSIVLGPTMVPWKSPCFACSRLGAALRVTSPAVAVDLLPQLAAGRVADRAPPWLLPLAADELVRELAAFFAGRYPRFLHQLVTLEPDGRRRSEPIEPTTDCPLCHGMNRRGIRRGRPAAPPHARAVWTRRAVVERAGGLRSIGPDEARRRAEAAMDVLGVRIEMDPPSDDTPGWALASGCGYFEVRRVPTFDPARPWLVRERTPPAYGKGTTAAQAWCSAAFEWFERESMSYSGEVEVVRAPYRLVRDLAVDVPRYLAGLVPGLDRGARFDPDADLDWLWGTCLRRRRPLLIPAAATCVFNARFRGSDIHWPRRGSSGQAAGCTLEDALLEGLLEVVEHDAWFTAYRTGLPFPALDLATVADPVAGGIISRLQAAGCRLQARDVSNELGVPVIEVYVMNDADPLRCFAGGRGAHLDPTIALRRALSEAMQGIYAAPASPDEPHRSAQSLYARFPHAKHLIGRVRGVRSLADIEDLSAGLDAGGAVDRVVERMAAALPDEDLCFVDRSRPELAGIHVVSVIAGGVLDEVTLTAAHIPERIRRLAPLDEMFLGRCD